MAELKRWLSICDGKGFTFDGKASDKVGVCTRPTESSADVAIASGHLADKQYVAEEQNS
jgi:hypothetical protein